MIRIRLVVLVLLVSASLAFSAGAGAAPPGVFLVTSNGWHSGIAVPREALAEQEIPEIADFPDAVWIEFGWGDADYYPSSEHSIGMALGAVLKPNPAVVHVVGLRASPDQVFPTQQRFVFRVDPEKFRNVTAYIAETFDRKGEARAQTVAPGLYPFSQFYPATGSFHMFNTCNTWTAGAVAAAGLPIDFTGVHHADELVERLRTVAPSQ
ncbi:MAG: DUF2459 domain-containing protein [Alphaproteobacteria bacterium]